MINMNKILIFIIPLLIISPLALSEASSLNFLTVSLANLLYCKIDGTNCNLDANGSITTINGTLWSKQNFLLVINQSITPGITGINITTIRSPNLTVVSEISLKLFANVTDSAVELVSKEFRPLDDALNDFSNDVDLVNWRVISSLTNISSVLICDTSGCIGDVPHTLNGSNHTGNLSASRVVKDTGIFFLLQDVADILDEIQNSIPINTLNLTNGNDFYNGVQVNESVEILSGDNLGNHTANQTLQMIGFSITEASNITVLNRLFLTNDRHWLKQGAEESFSGQTDHSFLLAHDVLHPEGEMLFILASQNRTVISAQQGLNGTLSMLGNSWGILPNNISDAFKQGPDLLNNLSGSQFCEEIYTLFGKSQFLSCDTSGEGASLLVHGRTDLWERVNYRSGLTGRGDIDFFMEGNALDVNNGSIHVKQSRVEELGVDEGQRATLLEATFDEELSPFAPASTGGGAAEWSIVQSINCVDDACARAGGGSGSPIVIMEANFSTVLFNEISVTFNYSTININTGDLFNVTIDNNSGDGEEVILNISIPETDFINFSATGSNNGTNITLRFYFSANNPSNEEVFVDSVAVTGTATEDTRINVTITDGRIEFGNQLCFIEVNGTGTGTMLLTCGNIIFSTNVTFESVTEVTLNITESITLNDTTITDWTQIDTNFSQGGTALAPVIFTDTSAPVTIGNGAAGINYPLIFDGEDNDGTFDWDEDNDRFRWSDDILMSVAEMIFFRGTTQAIWSSASNFLDFGTGSTFQWTVGATIEMMLNANQLIFNNGATDTAIDWSTDGTLALIAGAGQIDLTAGQLDMNTLDLAADSIISTTSVNVDAPVLNITTGNLTNPQYTCFNANCSKFIRVNESGFLIIQT